ncbi:hypothetical protein V1477_017319, partial [Vespula maculifrons]
MKNINFMGNLTTRFFQFTSAKLLRTICPCFQRNGEPNTAIIANIITPRISLQVGITAERDFSLVLFSQPSLISRHRPQASKPMITPRRNMLILPVNYVKNLQTTLVSAMRLFRETNWKQTTRLADMINREKSLKDIAIHHCPKSLYKCINSLFSRLFLICILVSVLVPSRSPGRISNLIVGISIK